MLIRIPKNDADPDPQLCSQNSFFSNNIELNHWFGLQEAGGMMTLTDAFVRVNRARGLELVSPGMANRVADIL
jgi:hypothetical protein